MREVAIMPCRARNGRFKVCPGGSRAVGDVVTYKGKPYKVAWGPGTTKYGKKYKLAFFDGTKEFWVDADAVAPSRGSGGGGSPRRGGRYECEDCGDYVTPGTRCWETGMMH